MQLGNNERVADNHEKTREEKEDDVDQAVVHLRCEVLVLDEGSMPTVLAIYVSKFLLVSICSRRQTKISSGDLFGICSTRTPQVMVLQLFELPLLKWLTNTDKIRLPSSSCKRTFHALCILQIIVLQENLFCSVNPDGDSSLGVANLSSRKSLVTFRPACIQWRVLRSQKRLGL